MAPSAPDGMWSYRQDDIICCACLKLVVCIMLRGLDPRTATSGERRNSCPLEPLCHDPCNV